MYDNNVRFTNDIKVISDSIAVQLFSVFYHYFLSSNNNYIEKYHSLMKVLKENRNQINANAMDEIFELVNTVPIVEIRNYFNSVFIGLPRALLEEDELLPLEEAFFNGKYPQFRQELLKENFPVKDVQHFQIQLSEFSRLIDPILVEMEQARKEAGTAYYQKNMTSNLQIETTGKFFGMKSKKSNSNQQIFDCLFRYCISWQRLIEVLRDHAKELYTIYHNFFYKGLIHKYERFYNDVKAMEPGLADSFFAEFLDIEIRAYDNEFDQKADVEKPEDDHTIRDAAIRVEKFFESNNAQFY